ncbi:MAG TPA: nuclear transport factor 2 family protein, partial [Chloroflexota bacterium]
MLRVWLAVTAGAACLIASGVVASMARAQATPSGNDPAAVISAYETARNRRDVEAALSYFADNAVVRQRNSTFSGTDEIRRFLTGISTRSRFIVVSDRHTSGNLVTWTERSG